jgi:ribosomal protein L11 methyltransferase
VKDLAQLLFTLPTDTVEAVSNLLTEDGRGVEMRDSETNASLGEGVAEVVVWLPTPEVAGLVARVETLLASLEELGTTIDPWAWSSEEVTPEEWQEAYKRYFKTQRIGRHFVIQPSWEDTPTGPRDILIRLDPGMAFGTGLHASTRLVIHALERLAHAGMAPQQVLDLGCGTGILSIAAAKLWPAARVVAIDCDETAVQICAENVVHNELKSRIAVKHQEASEVGGTYNLVLANLSSDALEALQPQMRQRVNDFGHLILSGLTSDRAGEVAKLYCKDLIMEPEYSEEAEGWRAFLLKIRE